MLNTIHYIWSQRKNIQTLVIGDFTQNYLSSYLGFLWALLGPLVTLAVLTVVFQVGFRVPTINTTGIPFVAWLACGMIPWLYIADALNVGATTIISYAFLVRKVAGFRMSLLPAIRIAASGIIHCVMIGFLFCLLLYYNIRPSWYWLQLIIYLPCMYIFLVGIALLTSALSVFIPDIPNLIAIVTNLGFWATPILWNPSMLPQHWHWIFIVNPAYYIIQGYRETFLEHIWIWERPLIEHGVFFLWVVGILLLGSFTFKRLRPHFADEL